MDLEIRDPVFFSVRHRGPDVAKYQRKLKNSNFPQYVSTAASASERERPDVEIFIPGALK